MLTADHWPPSQPLVNVLVMVFHFTLLSRLAVRYNAYYERRPVVTMMVTNAILFGVADTVAQTITAFRSRSRSRSGPGALPSYAKDDPIPLRWPGKDAAGIVVSEKGLLDVPVLGGAAVPAPGFDFERLSRFVAFGFCVAPLQYRWFGFLSKVFPITKGKAALGQAVKRVVFDQLVYAPFGMCRAVPP